MKIRIAAIFIVAIFLSLFITQNVFAGAWTTPKYKVWAQEYMKWSYSKEYYDANGDRRTIGYPVDNGRGQEYTMSTRVDYGITDWLNFLFEMEYKQATYREYDRPAAWGDFSYRGNHGFTNVILGGKYRLLQKPVVLSGQTRVFIYPGTYGIHHSDDTPFNENQPTIGYGDNSVEQRMLVGKKAVWKITDSYKLPVYGGLEGGYRWRNNHVCNGVVYFAEAGCWPVKNFIVKTELDGYWAHHGTGSVNEENYNIWRIGGIWEVLGGDQVTRQGKMFNIEFNYGWPLWGENTNVAQEWTLKVQTQF